MNSLSDVVSDIITSLQGCSVSESFRENTTSLDLTPPDQGGSYCLAAGTHRAFPHVFFKVVQEKDSYLDFAKALLAGDMHGPCFPKVYSITQVGDTDKYVVAIERVDREDLFDRREVRFLGTEGETSLTFCDLIYEAEYALKHGPSSVRWLMPEELDMVEQVKWLIDKTGAKPDFHDGNFGLKDGLLVCIDPIYNPKEDTLRSSYVVSRGTV